MKTIYILFVFICVCLRQSHTYTSHRKSFSSDVPIISLNCSAESSVIHVSKIWYENNTCYYEKCMQRLRDNIKTSCENRNHCSIKHQDCLSKYNYFNLSYICNDKPIHKCNFKVDSCNWKMTDFKIDSFDSDKPSRPGGYIYSTKENATLSSQKLDSLTKMCLTFLYNMSKNGRIIVKRNNNGVYIPVITVDPKDTWTRFNVTLNVDTYHYNYSVEIVTQINTQESVYRAMIGDIDILDGNCDIERQIFDFESKPSIELPDSMWTYTNPSKFTNNGSSCPEKDHTRLKEQSHFLSIEKGTSTNQTRLYSGKFNLRYSWQGDVCLRLWYMMTGLQNDTLQVYLRTGQEKRIISITNNIFNRGWLMHSHFIPDGMQNRHERMLVFEGSIEGSSGCIAVDDISLTKGVCHDHHVNDCFDLNQSPPVPYQLRCPMVNIPDKRIDVSSAYQSDTCQTYVHKMKNITTDCNNMLNQCKISHNQIPLETECLSHLKKEPIVLNIEYECRDTPLSTNKEVRITDEYHSSVTVTNPFLTTIQFDSATHGFNEITTDSKQFSTTTEEHHDDIAVSSQESFQTIGIVLGVVLSLFLACAVVIGAFIYLRKSNNLKKKKCNEKNIKGNDIRDSQQYVELGRSSQPEHIYQVTSNVIIHSRSDVDGHGYSSIDNDRNIPIEIGTEGIPRKYTTIANEQMSKMDERSVQHEVERLSEYDVIDPYEKGNNRIQSLENDGSAVSNQSKNNLGDDITVSEQTNLDGTSVLGLNECVSFTHIADEGDRMTDNHEPLHSNTNIGVNSLNQTTTKSYLIDDQYTVLDPSITGFCKSSRSESNHVTNDITRFDRSEQPKTEQSANLSFLDPSETGFYRSKLTTKEQFEDYAVLDPTETGFDRSKQLNEGHSENYTVLDPNETGFNRSKEFGKDYFKCPKDGVYGFAQHLFSKTNDDEYTSPLEETYDKLGTKRHKVVDENVYSHTVDTVYDSTSHVRRQDKVESPYDHFSGNSN